MPKGPKSKEFFVKSDQPWNPLTASLKPANVLNYLRLAEQGQLYYQGHLFAKLEEDPTILGNLTTRKSAVSNLSWEVCPFIDAKSEKASRRDETMASFVADVFLGFPNFESCLEDILDAIGTGYSHNIIRWAILDGDIVPIDLEWINRTQFQVDSMTGEFQVMTSESRYVPISQFQDRILSHYHKSRSGHPSVQGLLRALAIYYVFKRWDLKDWAIAIERYANVPVIGKYEGETDKQAVWEAVQKLGVDMKAAIPVSAQIDIIETARAMNPALYKQFIDFCNEEISIAILGQTLTTRMGDTGSYAASQTHDQVRHDILERDARQLQRTISTQLIVPIVNYNFGEQPRGHYPIFKLDYEQPEDLDLRLQRDLAAADYVDIPTSYFRRKYNWPEPEEGEEVAVRKGGGGGFGMEPFAMSSRRGAENGKKNFADGQIRVSAKQYDEKIAHKLAGRATKKAVTLYRPYIEKMMTLIENATDFEDLQQSLEVEPGDWGFMRSLGEHTEGVLGEAENAGRQQVQSRQSLRESHLPPEGSQRGTPALAAHSPLGVLAENAKGAKKRKTSGVLGELGAFASESGVAVDWNMPPEMAREFWNIHSFTMAHVENAAVIEHMKASLGRVIDEGLTYREFRDQANDIFDQWGVTYEHPHHLETVFTTNITSALQAGKFWELHDPDVTEAFPFLQYHVVLDEECPICGPFNNMIAERNDPIWNTAWPPLHHNCACDVEPIDADRAGKMTPTGQPPTSLIPEGFRQNPGATPEVLEAWASSKLNLDLSHQFYGLPDNLPRLPLPEDLQAATMKAPQEVWGFISQGKAMKHYLASYGSGEAVVVEVANGKVLDTTTIALGQLNKLRKGVLVAKNY